MSNAIQQLANRFGWAELRQARFISFQCFKAVFATREASSEHILINNGILYTERVCLMVEGEMHSLVGSDGMAEDIADFLYGKDEYEECFLNG